MPRDGEPSPTPIWLADPEYPAPCPCGRPMLPGQQMILGEGETGLTRLFHAECIQAMMSGDA